jgi:hypothetical protein
VLPPDDHRDAVEHHAVDPPLLGKALEGIAVALDLEAVDPAVDHGHVHPRCAVPERELVDDERVRSAAMFAEDLRVKS